MPQSLDYVRSCIRNVPNFPKPGIVFRDITPVLADAVAFDTALDHYESACRTLSPTKVVGIESRGFIFGAPVANRLRLPFIPVRKPGKLPWTTVHESYDLEYGSDAVHMHSDVISPGDKIVVVDDLIATGGTMLATCRLVEKMGGQVVGIVALIDLAFLPWRTKLTGYNVRALISYDTE